MDMTQITASVLASSPEIIVILSACVILMLALFARFSRGGLLMGLSIATIGGAAATTVQLLGTTHVAYSGMFAVDAFSNYFKILLYLATALTVLMSDHYLDEGRIAKGEYYVLVLFALVGAMIMVSGADLLIIYIGLELQALSIYVLVGFLKANARSNEAALKYVILGAFSSGLLLFGLSLFYGLTGTTQLADIAGALAENEISSPLLVFATLLLAVGLLFKVGAVPFHMWVPDIYEGAPSPITGFMSVAGKAAAFAVVLRIFMLDLGLLDPIWRSSVIGVAILTMGVGSLAALVQTNVKRMLAYSSIAHAGFLLLGLVAGGVGGLSGILLYLLIFAFMNLGLFALIVLLNPTAERGEPINSFAGLAREHGGLALLGLVFLFSLAGIPPTGGFFAKFYVLAALVETGHVALAVVAVLFSAIAAWFYIRIIMLMYMTAPEGPFRLQISVPMRIVLATAVAGTIVTGVLPAWFLGLARLVAEAGLG